MNTTACGATHEPYEMPAEDASRFQEPGLRIDVATISALLGAAESQCLPCQQLHLDTLQSDPASVVRMVELAALLVQEELGGVPSGMVDSDTPSLSSQAFRALVTAGLDQQHVPMLAAARALSDVERRQAALDALELIVGMLFVSSVRELGERT